MWLRTRASLAAGLAALAVLLAGCGTQSSIPGALSQDTNSSLSAELSSVGDAVSSRSCGSAGTALAKLDATLGRLPAATNRSLVTNLRQGAATLRGLALTECHGTRTRTSSSSSSTSSTTESTSSTPTTPPSTPSTPTTPTTPTVATTTNALPGTGTVTQLGTGSGGTTPAGGAGGAGTLGGGGG